MSVSTRWLIVAVCLFSASVLGVSGCKSSSASGAAGAELSGPPVPYPQYGARMPRQCSPVTDVPTAEQARELVQCNAEGIFDGNLWLATDLQVQMGAAHDPNVTDVNSDHIDSSVKVYQLQGSATGWACKAVTQSPAGQNCQKFPAVAGATGACWKKLDGQWKCSMGIGGAGSNAIPYQPGPMTY